MMKFEETPDNLDSDLLPDIKIQNPNEQAKNDDPWYIRYSACFLMCLIGFGTAFCYDNPAALQDDLERDLKISTATFSSFYSWYSSPNVIMCFFGGFLVDRVFGIRLGAIAFLTIALIGQVVFAFGAYQDRITTMDLGRLILGIGIGSLSIVQNAYAVTWFFGKELNLVFGILLSVTHLGSTFCLIIMTPLYDLFDDQRMGNQRLGIVLLISALALLVSLLSSILLGLLYSRRRKPSATIVVSNHENIQLKDVFKFPLMLWLIFFTCVTFYCSFFPFISLSKVFFMSKYGFEPSQAGELTSLIYIAASICLPICGFLIDLIGFNTLWLLGGLLLAFTTHLLLSFTFLTPLILMIMLGVSYSFIGSSLWPMVALIVPANRLSTAYGLMLGIQSIGLTLTGFFAGYIVDVSGYFAIELFFMTLLCFAILFTSILHILDHLENGILGISKKQRDQRFTKSLDTIL